jgi:hypothetical protein
MRLVFLLMLILLGFVLAGFLVTNPGEQVDITLGSRLYEGVPLALVALVALTVGVAFTAVVALFEGATIRLANRRLRREIQRLENEIRFLRSQSEPTAPLPVEPAPRAPRADPSYDDGEVLAEEIDRPSAPVYGPEPDDVPTRRD